METFEVKEYDHFVTFTWNKCKEIQVVVQYRRGDVWKDEAGIWQLRSGKKPAYSFANRTKRNRVRLSPAILEALANETVE